MILKSRKARHIDYIYNRMRELHNEIVQEFMHNDKPDWRMMKKQKALLLKYRRRIQLLKK